MNFDQIYDSLLKKFEKLFGYRLAFIVYKLLYKISSSQLSINPLKKLNPKFFSKFYSIAYKFYFLKSDLRKAYYYRISLAIELEKALENNMRKKASNYLDIIAGNYLSEFNLGEERNNYLKTRPKNFVTNNFAAQKKLMNSVLVCGPGSELNSINFSQHDLIVLNKPINLTEFKIDPQKVVLILNNQWSLNKKDKISEWIKEFPAAKIFTPNRIEVNDELNSGFKKIPEVPFHASLMGLQRSTILLLANFEIVSFTFEGFNFSLSETPYKSWYPSLLKQHHGSFASGFLQTNMIHDFLLNYMFIKKFVDSNKYNISGSILKYTDMNTNQVLELFSSKIRAYKKLSNQYK